MSSIATTAPTAKNHEAEDTQGVLPRRTRRVAVTGAAGHFGMLVLRRLAKDPSVGSILALDVRPPRLAGDKIEGAKADIRDERLDELFAGCDAVVHLAFAIHRYKPRDLFDSINVEGSKNVFRAAQRAGVSQVVYASSVAAYGMVHGHPQPILEDTRRVYQPEFAYSRAKFEVEAFLDEFEGENPEMTVTRLRPVVMVGERMESLMGATLRRRFLPTTSGAPFPVVWDEDVAEAVALAIEQEAEGAFNLSARETRTAYELAPEVGMKVLPIPRWLGLAAAHLSPLATRFGMGGMIDPAWIRSSDVPMVLDSEKARRELGWRPQCDTAVDVMRHFVRNVPRRLHRRIATSLRRLHGRPQPEPLVPENDPGDVHLHLTGPVGGDITLGTRADRWHVDFGLPWPVGPATRLAAESFLELLEGSRTWGSLADEGMLVHEGGPSGGEIVLRAVSALRGA